MRPNQSQCHVRLPFADLGYERSVRLKDLLGDATHDWDGNGFTRARFISGMSVSLERRVFALPARGWRTIRRLSEFECAEERRMSD